MKTLILTSDDTRAIVRRVGLDAVMDEMIDRITTTLRTYDIHETVVPVRAGFHYETPTIGLIEWMPIMRNGNRTTVKIVGYHPRNPTDYGIPTILATVSAYDTATGHLVGLADGTFLTALRTGAASAVATQHLAREDSKVVGLIGCGAQAVSQLHAISRCFDIEQVLIYDIDDSVLRSFPQRISILGLRRAEVGVADTAAILAESDILCTATSVDVGGGPVFSDGQSKPGLHINATGSDFKGKVEIPKELLLRSLVVPDVLEQAISEGECQQLDGDNIGPELHDVVKDPERFAFAREQRTVFDSTGWALEDHVALEMMMHYAGELGLGTEMEIESISHDAKNPYEFVANHVAISTNHTPE